MARMDRQPRRLPKNYALIRDIVHANGLGSHQTAGHIYATARAAQPAIGFATIHRGLARLCETGDILKIDVPGGGAAWYEPPAPTHAHLLCDRCSAVVDVDYTTSAETLAAIAAREGVRIAGEILTFRGLCGRCVTATLSIA